MIHSQQASLYNGNINVEQTFKATSYELTNSQQWRH